MTDNVRKITRERIEALGISQSELARRINIETGYMNALLLGRREGGREVWLKLLSALDLTLTVTTKDPAPNPSETENG